MKRFLILSFLLLALTAFSSQVYAVTITPVTQLQWSGSTPHNPDADDIPGLVGYSGTVDELYKADLGKDATGSPIVTESGSWASYYKTTYSNTPSDPQDALIEWTGTSKYISGSPLYLLVKGGKAEDPYWYIFDLLRIDTDGDSSDYEWSWNGMESIFLDGFWPDSNAISHVSIYGTAPVPEPATMLLLGIGLLGVAGVSRKKI